MRTNRVLAGLLVLMVAALVVIGTLQYRWLERVAEGERQQMRRNLEFTLGRLETEISGEIHSVFRAFLGPEDEDVRGRAADWRQAVPHPEIVASVHVAERDGNAWHIRQLDLHRGTLVDAPLPPQLEPLRRRLDEVGDRGPDERFPLPMDARIPALFVISMPPEDEPEVDRRPRRVTFVEFDRRGLGAVVAEHAARVAEGLDVELSAGGTLLYRSPDAGTRPPDVEKIFRPIAPRLGPGGRPGPRERRPGEPPPPDGWRLAISHRGGGLEAIVSAAHRRNLAVAALVLLLLGAATALLVALLRRGERLRAQQSQFVAAMSHELNTPLAILRVASENLHDGIVQDPEKVSRYVRTIARETANLSEMVNHVLELAGMRAGVAVTGRQPVDAGAVIQEAVTQSRFLGTATDIAIDIEVPPDLPRILGDERSLTRAIQNLVTNAMRHAGAGKWVGVRASHDGDGFVRIVVEDRGPGIDAADVTQVFEPFYRGSRSGAVRGTGLGLTIVKQIIQEHGGTIAIERGRATGAAFIVRLPAEVHS